MPEMLHLHSPKNENERIQKYFGPTCLGCMGMEELGRVGKSQAFLFEWRIEHPCVA
jgi:hypothetical protein